MIDAYELAMLPIAHLASQPEPYDRYCPGTGGLTENYRKVVNYGIRGYQLYAYLGLVSIYFGEATREQVRRYQLTVYETGDDSAETLASILAVIEGALGTHGVKVLTAGGEVEVPVEMNVALAILLDIPFSPDYVPNISDRNGKIASMGIDVDWCLADCLSSAREEIIRAWWGALAHFDVGDMDAARARRQDA